ncbi:hypothetical protein ATY37_12550 [Vibrio cidicii]|uniref:Peptidase M60 domain-containing protein n=1 Tax=Vibrio cidicii TaxID=1763883 RepID=A0A151L0E1_9VIBR|nr:ImpA family metalloprotease [Vibrio cidicii]KYN89791.1 hypothetical protein ATY37_12550 [Vibrio cidicii]
MKKIGYLVAVLSMLTGCGGDNSSSPAPEIQSEVEKALQSGNALLVSDPNDLISAASRWVERNTQTYNQLWADLANEAEQLYWDPTHDAAVLAPTYGFNDVILQTNKAMQSGYPDQTLTLGIGGLTPSGNRYAALGSNPFRTAQRFPTSVNQAMEKWLENVITWLNQGRFASNSKVVLAQLDQSYYFPDEQATRNWLTAKFADGVTYNAANQCDGEKLLACLAEKPDLLILSQHLNDGDSIQPVVQGLAYALKNDIPVLYLHWDGGMTELGTALFEQLHIRYVGDNYWRKLGVVDWQPNQLRNRVPEEIATQLAFLQRFASNGFDVDLAQCDDKSCEATANMDTQFYPVANQLRAHLQSLDKAKIDLFASDYYEYEKLIVLLADRYRQDVRFPMDKFTTPSADFLQSYFADYIQYHSRKINPKQPDMGNFSRSEFGENVARVAKSVSLLSKRHFRAAGVYALPGESFQVTRRDNSAVKVSIAINSLRSGATHEFSKEGYNRPKHLTSTTYEVKSGETITLTSAYGGPIQVHFDGNDLPVELTFSHVAEHPVWRSSEDNVRFAMQLQQGEFDWAELITPGFEVHSKRDKMLQSISASDWGGDAAAMAQATEQYVHNYPHALAGFQGPGIDVIDEVQGYAEQKGWQVETIDVVKHMNADQATCGYGCSGNPYDAYWAFSPLGHGDLHELGHGLEKGRFRFATWEGHSTTNYYSYFSKSRYFKETGKESQCQSLDFKGLFELLQQSRLQADANAYMAAQDQSSWSWGARVYIQMMMAAQQQGVLQDGWHLLGRLHLIEREFNRLAASPELWDKQKAMIGFEQYTYDEAKSINNNDWLLIAISYVLQRDMRQYLDMWGLTFSNKAKVQVASGNYVLMPMNYFVTSSTGYCTNEFATQTITVDGSTAWPR